PPGAGKTYLCNRFAQEFSADGAVHVIMSDLLREEAKRPGSPWAKEINQKLPTGELMSGGLTLSVLLRYIQEDFPADGKLLLLDGFPRSIEQAKEFDEMVGKAQKTISLRCSENVRKARLSARGRDDDAHEIAESRFHSYLNETVPAIDHLKDHEHQVMAVSSDQSGDEGFDNFIMAIQNSWITRA
ncbi:MAG: hypothetical protein Q9174_006300, partial [Haloplaca sp. 1 TL-2023]